MSRNKDKYKFGQSKDGTWYWRIRSGNGRNLSDGCEGYKTRAGCLKALWHHKHLPHVGMEVVEEPSQFVKKVKPKTFFLNERHEIR